MLAHTTGCPITAKMRTKSHLEMTKDFLFYKPNFLFKKNGNKYQNSFNTFRTNFGAIEHLVYYISICPARNSRITLRVTNHYKARCARVLAWSSLAGRWPAQLVTDLFWKASTICCMLYIEKVQSLLLLKHMT